VLPQLAQGQGNTFWVIPSEITAALQGISHAFDDAAPPPAAPIREPASRRRQPTETVDDAVAASGCAADAHGASSDTPLLAVGAPVEIALDEPTGRPEQ
jgi:hypothetical protein